MKILLLLSLVLSVSCGKDNSKKSSSPLPAKPPVVKTKTTLFNVFESVDGNGLHGINSLDFREAIIGVQSDIFELELMCDGTYGNSGQVNGADPSRLVLTGDKYNGILQIGHTKYVGASDPACREISKEAYTYELIDDVLELCMVNYPYCAQYKVVE